MNILFLSTRSPYPPISGHSIRTYYTLKGVAQKHNVFLISFIQNNEHELKEENLEHLNKLCTEVHPIQIPVNTSKKLLLKTILASLFSPLPYVIHKYDSPAFRNKIKEILSGHSFDLIHFDLLYLTPYINEFKSIPSILVNHNVESHGMLRWAQKEKNIFKKLFLYLEFLKLRSYEKRAVIKFNECVVVSEHDKLLLQKMSPNMKFTTVPNGTDTEYFKPGSDKIEPNSILWIGAMNTRANMDAVLFFINKILPIIFQKIPDAQATFIGQHPPQKIKMLSKSDHRIIVLDFVEDVRPHLSATAVFIVPIRIGSGTRLKILNALAMEKAIVSTTLGSEGIDIQNNKNILLADTPEHFADCVVKILKDETFRKNIESNTRKVALKYDWEKIQELQEKVYQGVLNH